VQQPLKPLLLLLLLAGGLRVLTRHRHQDSPMLLLRQRLQLDPAASRADPGLAWHQAQLQQVLGGPQQPAR
jgi:hypothetical protein